MTASGGIPRVVVLNLAWVACLASACGDDDGPSDEELLEKFVEDVSGHVDEAYVERTLSYLAPERYPIDVKVPRRSGVYDARRAPEIIDHYRKIMLGRFRGDDIEVSRHHIEIDGDRATVKMSMRTRLSPLEVEVGLRKPRQGVWKVSRVHVQRSMGLGGF